MIIYQNLAYCRYLQLWTIFYLCNIVKYNPCISLIIVSIFHLYNIDCNNITSKKIGILLQDYVLILLIILKIIFIANNFSIFSKLFNYNDIFANIFVLIFYLVILELINVNPIKLYTEYLPEDDKNFKDESYYNYFKRIWSSFFCIN